MNDFAIRSNQNKDLKIYEFGLGSSLEPLISQPHLLSDWVTETLYQTKKKVPVFIHTIVLALCYLPSKWWPLLIP